MKKINNSNNFKNNSSPKSPTMILKNSDFIGTTKNSSKSTTEPLAAVFNVKMLDHHQQQHREKSSPSFFRNGFPPMNCQSNNQFSSSLTNQLFLNTQQSLMNNFDLKSAFVSPSYLRQSNIIVCDKIKIEPSNSIESGKKISQQERKLCNGKIFHQSVLKEIRKWHTKKFE